MNDKNNNVIYLPNNEDQVKMLMDIHGKKNFKEKATRKRSILEGGGIEEMTTSKSGRLVIESDINVQVDNVLKRLNPTGQKAFVYLINRAIKNDYSNDFEVDINEILNVLGMIRRTNSIERIYESLESLVRVSFKYDVGEYTTKGTYKKGYTETSPILSRVRLKRTFGKTAKGIVVELGSWFNEFKRARKSDKAFLLTLDEQCLSTDIKKHPFSFSAPLRMAQYARTNNTKKKEWHTLKLKTVFESVGTWESAVSEMKKRGFNDDRSLVGRLTQSLDHASPLFGFTWEWIGDEPSSIAEAEIAKIRFKFSKPLINANKEEPAKS